MIIRRLQSENILRYKELDLNNLPTIGRILIAGANESGKSAILETLTLAIFGRTSNLPCESVAKAVKWGADSALVSLDFIGRDNIEYTLFRYFDADGIQRARLDQRDIETPLAQGVEAVNQAMIEVIGFDFQQFTNAFYLTHGRHAHARPGEMVKELAGVAALENLGFTLTEEIKEKEILIATRIEKKIDVTNQIDLLNLQESALGKLENRLDATRKQAAGAASTVERWEGFDAAMVQSANRIQTATLRMENTSTDIGLASWQSRQQQMDEGLEELESICLGGHVEMDVAPSHPLRQWLTRLQTRLTSLEHIIQSVQEEEQRLLYWLKGPVGKSTTDISPTYADESHWIEQTLTQLSRRQRRQGWGAKFFLLVALILWLGYGLIAPQTQQFALVQLLTPILAQHISFWNSLQTIFLMPAAFFCTLLALWNFINRWRMKGKIATTHMVKKQLVARATEAQTTIATILNAANQSLAGQVEILSSQNDFPWSAALHDWIQEEGRPLLDPDSLRHYLAGLSKQSQTFQIEISSCREEAHEQLKIAQEEHANLLSAVASLENEVETEKFRRLENQRLHAQIITLEADNQRDHRDIEIRLIAKELLKGACVGLSSHFNQELHRFISRTAPLFTQGRYHHLRIDDTLNVTVFSGVKNDFIQIEEISTGVRRQLTLAVRMALAQALATRTRGSHFIALDEPFAYFDRQRCRESLDALLRISDKITQVWVVGQEFDAESSATGLYLHCAQEQDILIMTAG